MWRKRLGGLLVLAFLATLLVLAMPASGEEEKTGLRSTETQTPTATSRLLISGGQVALPLVFRQSTPTPTLTPTATPTATPTMTPEPQWETVATQNFEGSFPKDDWKVYRAMWLVDCGWGRDDYKPHTGNRSAYCAKSGSEGRDPEGNEYPNDMKTWLEYGPFDLSDARLAQFEFWYWLDSEEGFDYLCWGDEYYGECDSGDSGGWVHAIYDLSHRVGDSQVYIGIKFESDESYTDQGAFVDDIVIRKAP